VKTADFALLLIYFAATHTQTRIYRRTCTHFSHQKHKSWRPHKDNNPKHTFRIKPRLQKSQKNAETPSLEGIIQCVRQTQDQYQTHKQERTKKKIAQTHTRCNTSDLACSYADVRGVYLYVCSWSVLVCKKIAKTHTRCNTSDLAALVVEHETVQEINTKSMQGGDHFPQKSH